MTGTKTNDKSPTTSLVISENDLEASAIIKVAKTLDIDIVDLKLGWGEKPDPSCERLRSDRLGQHVILVECPSPHLEERLRRDGKSVEIIDHHLYFSGLDGTLPAFRSFSNA